MHVQTSFFTLIGRAVRLTLARSPLYGTAVAATIALQGVLVATRVPHALEIGNDIFPAFLSTIVYAFVDADSKAEPPPLAAIWERALERSWAVIVIEFLTGTVLSVALAGTQTDSIANMLLGTIIMLVTTLLIFADVSATIDDGVPFWWLVPAAFQRSITATWHGPTLVRAIALLAIELTITFACLTLAAALHDAHVANAEFWGEVPIEALVTPPLAALTVLVYRDARPAEPQDET